MGKFDEHFLLDVESAKEYCVDVLKYFNSNDEIECVEIGDGNINYVFKIWDKISGKSIIIKQADRLLRSSGRPLDVYRNKIEAEAMKIQSYFADNYVPKIYYYDENMFALSMEDISEYKNLRIELSNNKIFKELAEDITTFLVDTLLPTTDLVMSRSLKKEYVKFFTNVELCDITEDLVFTEPYYDYKGRNILLDENKNFVETFLYDNQELQQEIGILRNKFMNNPQALIHGDLHSGSIFINEAGIKIIDPEFAFYGPIGYDVGNVIGNLFFPWANKYYTESNNKEFIDWISNTIKDIIDLFIKKLSDKFDEIVTLKLYNNGFKENYIKTILEDSLGYAGTEIIRRVVGDSKVYEITSVNDNKVRSIMEKSLIKMGINLIMNRERLNSGLEVVKNFDLIIQ